MAELVLGKAGAVLGGEVGRALGTLAGAFIGANFLSPPVQGSRIKDFHITEGREGASMPIVYGRARVGGQLIWAAQFRERSDVEGGKGGPRIEQYSYSLSFAVALCEGEIARVSRCWVNGEPFDLSQVTWRLYRGTDDQAPDPLIEAIEGEAPAYRGTAYIVFEDMPVDQFGARMPQLSFEIVRPAGAGPDRLESMVRAVNMIPGSGEFALSTDIVRRRIGRGRETAINLHGPELKSDFEASLDQLEAELPNVTRVNLVVAWFGNDLRCGECLIRPGVEIASKTTKPFAWSVAGLERDEAYVVSATDGKPNYGGTPADRSVVQAVAALKARGYHVTLYPFLLMDIPPGNGLADPLGGAEQPAFPWRGRITPVGGDAAGQVEEFFEQYRPFVLHYAALAQQSEADGLLIGSELVALTRTKAGGVYPAVQALCELAVDARGVVGPDVEISYAADWTEYGGQASGGDLGFPLDALWAHDAISYVGLDWYPPIADWRDGEDHADASFGDGRSRAYLMSNVAGGEGFDWFYADEDGRAAQERLAIADGAYSEPWVWSQKDIASWWSHAHHPRVAGVRAPAPTAWVAGMKPVRFVEMGVPAVDKGANQPNVFYDPKSSESALPRFSDGARDDLIQRAAIEAFHAWWSDDAHNPVSEEYDGRMLPEDGVALWAWDARPFPAFPASGEWGDAGNWRLGHWLNGRVSLALLPDVVADVCARAGVDADVRGLRGIVSGYVCEGPLRARAALEPLATVYGVDATERDGSLVFRMRGAEVVELSEGRLVEDGVPALALVRDGLEAPEVRVRLRHVDADGAHAPGVALSDGAAEAEVADMSAAVAMDRAQALRCANALAEQANLQRDRVQFAMAADGVAVEPGDVVTLGGGAWRVIEVSDGATVKFEAVRAGAMRGEVRAVSEPVALPVVRAPVEPDVVIVDGPPLPGEEDDVRPLVFAFAEPWVGALTVSAGGDASSLLVRGQVERACAMGELVSANYPHVSGRWQEAEVLVHLPVAALQSRLEGAVLNGANAALVETVAGWELVQYLRAELVGEETWKLSGLLRGQQGSEEAMAAGAEVGARVVFLTGAQQRVELADWEHGLQLDWRVWRAAPSEAVAWVGMHMHAGAAARMWSPAHLRAVFEEADLRMSWTRRARKGGDAWGAGEPLHELPEAYRVRVSKDGEIFREWDVAVASCLYDAGEQAGDFPVGGEALIEVAQLGPDGQPSGWMGLSVMIPAP